MDDEQSIEHEDIDAPRTLLLGAFTTVLAAIFIALVLGDSVTASSF